MGAVDLPISIIPKAQAEKVRLRNNEVQILIEDLCDMLRCASGGYRAGEVFEQRARDGGQKVDISRGVKPTGQVVGDGFNIRSGGFNEIDDGDIRNRISRSIQVPNSLVVRIATKACVPRRRSGTYKWIVTPHALKSLTRSTLLMTSRPMLSKTRIFQIGLPSSLRMGVVWVARP